MGVQQKIKIDATGRLTMGMEDKDLFVRETRQLLTDIEDVAKDGRLLAHSLTETIEGVVKLQCDAIEERMRALMARIDAVEFAYKSETNH
jgi:3-methyladenine DNA glycosylase AlkC